jgi:hypothetical protein
MDANRPVAVTVDVHKTDKPAAIRTASEALAEQRIRATFFVPASLLRSRRHRTALRTLPALGHEVGSHGYAHDWIEVDALVNAAHPSQLRFLERAQSLAADFYGAAPTAFRSPVWCRLGRIALDELVRLGYTVDSSATPQRLMVLSSLPFGPGWTLCPRRPHYIRPTLLEIPTSTLVVPLGSPTFRFLGRTLSALLLSLIIHESRLFSDRVITVQFDACDFNGTTPVEERLSLRDFTLQRHGGFPLRRYLRQSSAPGIIATTRTVLQRIAFAPALTLSELRKTCA